jgi:acetylornithine deacetylase
MTQTDPVSLLKKLTEIESPSKREGKLASFIANYLKNLGYKPTIEYSNVLLSPEKEFIVTTHLDTFKVLSTFSFDGEYAYGTGVSDAKASIVAILLALERIDAKELNFGVTFFCDEEEGGSGSENFCKLYKPKMAIILEPTNMRIANVQYGGLELRVKAKGVSAHGATPEMGSNAVEKCIITAYNLLTSIKDAVVSVQYFKGGDPEDYVIPDECEMRVELFFKPEVKAESMLTRVKELLPQNGFEIIVKEAYDGFISRRASALLEKAMKKVGCQIEFSDMPSWTDAVNLYKHANCDSAIFGPGELHLCHTKRERVRIKDIELTADVLIALNDLLTAETCL